jgi:hypothetical protein
MKIFIFIIGLLILAFFAQDAQSDDRHHVTRVIQNDITSYPGVASAISASQCHFDGGSFDLQLCGGVGFSNGNQAATFGVGKKYNDFLLNGTITTEDNETSVGIGMNWKIK